MMSGVKQEQTAQNGEETSMMDTAPGTGEQVWDEARLEAAMAQLQEMYRQVRELRSTIPKMVAPFTVKQHSPEIMHRKVAKSIATANEEVRTFRQLMEDESSKLIFEHAKESRSKNPKGIKPFKITDYPDWYERKL